MTVHALFPAFLDVAYHSPWGTHHALIPTKEWNAVPLVPLNVLGSYENWSGVPCDGEEMVDEYVDRFLAFMNANVLVDTVTVYTVDTPTSPAIPRAIKAYGQAGVSVSTAWAKAVQKTWTMRDTAFNIVKAVMLDVPSAGGFDKVTNISGSPEALAFFGALSAPGWAFSSRAGFRPATLQSLTTDINDKLRKEYGMG